MIAGPQVDARAHLLKRGLLRPGERATVTPLAGGVSGEVARVTGADVDVVVKSPLERLNVAHEWRADRHRVIAEAEALRAAASITPDAVPHVIDLDTDSLVLVLEAADPGWQSLRDQLMAGLCDASVATQLGLVLAQWHAATLSGSLPPELYDTTTFVALRIDPFYRFVAERHDDLAVTINAAADALLAHTSCLVHGDFSPKNILIGPSGDLWVLDWEVAHVGCAAFDLAFMLSHLLLKTLHRADSAADYARFARAFLDGYRREADSYPSERQLLLNVGCLLLARVDGKSPAPYLTTDEATSARSLASVLLTGDMESPLGAWEVL